MSTPDDLHETTLALLALLDDGEDAASERAIDVRARLARATADAGRLEDALYQADELLKDARRAHGEDAEATATARAALAHVEAALPSTD